MGWRVVVEAMARLGKLDVGKGWCGGMKDWCFVA